MALLYNEIIAKLPRIEIETQRLILRPPQYSDWSDWVEVRFRNFKFLQPFEPEWPKKCLNNGFFKRRLAHQQKCWQSDTGQYFILIRKEDNALIGGVNFNNITRGAAHCASFGYWLDERHQGCGYMREALTRMIKYGFEEMNLHRIDASTLLHNTRSKNLLLRSGFQQQGVGEKYLKINGEWQDHYLFGLTIERWQAQHTNTISAYDIAL